MNVSQVQADALINSERAWVMADVEWDTGKRVDGKAHVVEGSGTDGDTTGIYIVCLAKRLYTCEMYDLAQGLIRFLPLRFLP